MAYEFANSLMQRPLIPVYPGASTVTGFIGTTDVGKLCVASSNNGVLAVGTTADFSQTILGIIASVPVATTPGSSVPFYVRPILQGDQVRANFSTVYSTALPGSTDRGKYLGFPNTTTPAAAAYLNIGTLSNVKGTTSGCFFKITAVDVSRREVTGIINSSHLAL